MLNSIAKWVKEHIILSVVSTVLVGALTAFTYWAIATFSAGYEIQKRQEIKDILIDLMIDKEQMNTFVGQALASDTLKIAREVSSNNIIKAVADLSEKDSINLRKELRLHMDLKESQTVAKEIGWTYRQMNRLPYLVDSIFSANRRASAHTSH